MKNNVTNKSDKKKQKNEKTGIDGICCTYPYDHVCVYRQPNSEWKSNYRTNSSNNNVPSVIT